MEKQYSKMVIGEFNQQRIRRYLEENLDKTTIRRAGYKSLREYFLSRGLTPLRRVDKHFLSALIGETCELIGAFQNGATSRGKTLEVLNKILERNGKYYQETRAYPRLEEMVPLTSENPELFDLSDYEMRRQAVSLFVLDPDFDIKV